MGVGRLGLAILSYPGFAPEGFRIVAAFDADPNQVGQRVGGVGVYAMEDLARLVQDMDISIGVVAVPGIHAQQVVDQLVECGVKGHPELRAYIAPEPRRSPHPQHRPRALAPVHDLLSAANAAGAGTSGRRPPRYVSADGSAYLKPWVLPLHVADAGVPRVYAVGPGAWSHRALQVHIGNAGRQCVPGPDARPLGPVPR